MTQIHPTEFQQRVYAAVRRIPRGSVTTYKLLARAIGCGSCRAVGQALRRNPFAPNVPCHRVIASGLSLGGFDGGTRGPCLARKRALLEAEGVSFVKGRLRDPDRLFRFSPLPSPGRDAPRSLSTLRGPEGCRSSPGRSCRPGSG